jgi:hypothetical protein
MNYHQYRCRDHHQDKCRLVELASSFCAEDSTAGKAAGVSSDGEVWVMCQLGSCSAGGCGMGGGLRRSAS